MSNTLSSKTLSPLSPQIAQKPGEQKNWGQLYGSALALAIAQAAQHADGMVLLLTPDMHSCHLMQQELSFFLQGQEDLPILSFPDWETLPYDMFSPYEDIISERLQTLYTLQNLPRGILLVPVSTCMHRLPPVDFVDAHSLLLKTGDRLQLEEMRMRLERSGYQCVSQVMSHGEFAVRGSLLDLFPMGQTTPYRIDLFDEEVESIRTFDPETQRSIDTLKEIRLLPAREFPLHDEAIRHFRDAYRSHFEGDPTRSVIYREVSQGHAPAGIEYYLPLFFDETASLFDYLPANSQIFTLDEVQTAAESFWQQCMERHEIASLNPEAPALPPRVMFMDVPELFSRFKACPRTQIQRYELGESSHGWNYASEKPVSVALNARAERPTEALTKFLQQFGGRVLFCAESPGRREVLLETLRGCDLSPAAVSGWQEFVDSDMTTAVTVAPLEQGLQLSPPSPRIAIIAENQLFGEQVLQRRRRQKGRSRDADAIIRNLSELEVGSPVVHEEHGVGRYLGLQALNLGGFEQEYLTLEYAAGDKLYVPVASLHLISRYTGVSPDKTPLHRLGSGQWEKAKRKAREKVRDVAAELLAIYAKREARLGFAYPFDDLAYRKFAATFPFEETPDQLEAIEAVMKDMQGRQPMDRLVCGDVGFGKTEVAMRAAFLAVHGGKQVAILVPTTLLAEQHFQNFRDRFADWPVQVESLSRFRSAKDQKQVLKALEAGTVDIVIGTHKLLQEDVKYKRLGLVIIDEEHRFGVRQKDKFKALRAEIDVLTLTATPIPRTLNMALGGMRELSIIASPPAKRLSVKTFVNEWNDALLKEACMREIKRGGQIYFLHNEVESIEKMANKLQDLLPEANIRSAHGQMRERDLERVMSDFYHQRFNLLVCTTIIETGIDIPTANTIIINKADRFGLAQLYQLRGRVGRSHHRAYAYLFVPSRRALSADAKKRLEAIEAIEELGTGFTLATHDLEIRGAGELLGDEQSGQMQEIGFTLYSELLERAVKALKEGRELPDEDSEEHAAEIELAAPALIPEDYLPDIHARLILYKRIASARNKQELKELQVEMIDRFGLLPEPAKNLFGVAELRLMATPLGIHKLELGEKGGRVSFVEKPNIDPMKIIQLIQQKSDTYQLDGKDRLRISKGLKDFSARITFASQFIDLLAH